MRLPVYVPKLAALATIQPGAGIVGGQRVASPGKLLIDYEDNRAGADNIRIMWNQFCQARRPCDGLARASPVLPAMSGVRARVIAGGVVTGWARSRSG
jgi:hypothetical protein